MLPLRSFYDHILNLLLPESGSHLLKITAADLLPHFSRKVPDGEYFSLFDYRDPLIRDLLLALKFRGKRRIAKIFAEVLYDPLIEELADRKLFSSFEKPLLVPVPLSHSRERQRGYNQVELIAVELAALDGNRSFQLATDALQKIKDTPPQTSLQGKAAREENIRGAFATANAPRISERNVILLDDITTTGATLREASAVLRAAGAKQIFCVAIAH
ncbi:hypothetical protein A2761_01045 [Candidatus Kaiserbacteria bacterium RIFCSPHIGHO2_01_FULL_51_33]|nr:MAG: hypothetical protein A2761_01045 [Candidatus Kaiserbacteria bacterium RIFCSPHIGHO2_01_FULL_51_33]